jgi:transposase-like protein
MYYQGLSVRKVAEQVSQIFGEDFSQVAVWGWLQKYAKLVSHYVETLAPKLSGKYHHDETQISIKGSSRWFWEVIDEDTRFLVAHQLSVSRTSEEAATVFAQALQKQRPVALFTDGSFAYDDAFNKVFYTRYKASKVEWVRRVGIRARETNNIVERLHGTLKDRLRPMRGLKGDSASKNLLDGYVTYYNFCRKHMSLGKTPAEAAGIGISGWKDLIVNAQSQTTKAESETVPMEVKVVS